MTVFRTAVPYLHRMAARDWRTTVRYTARYDFAGARTYLRLRNAGRTTSTPRRFMAFVAGVRAILVDFARSACRGEAWRGQHILLGPRSQNRSVALMKTSRINDALTDSED